MYTLISMDAEPKVIGVQNGVYQVELDEKRYSKKDLKELMDMLVIYPPSSTDVAPDLLWPLHFKKLKSAKLTSFMGYCPYFSHCPFLIDQKVVDILKEFKIQNHRLYPIHLYDQGQEITATKYYLLFMVFLDWDLVDYPKTVFYRGGYGDVPKVKYQFNTREEWYNSDDEGFLELEKLQLNHAFDSELDFFQVRSMGIFISNRLKRAFQENGVTGLVYSKKTTAFC